MIRSLNAAVLAATILAASAAGAAPDSFRPPAVPLVTSDPFLSIWSEADHLNDDATRHWTHREHSLVSLIRVDGKTYRLMGNTPKTSPPLTQTALRVTPTRSIYDFEDAGVHVTLTFTTPALPNDLDALTRPVTYLTWKVRSADGASHTVSIYDSVSSQLTVDRPEEKVTWARETAGDLTALHIGTATQRLFGTSGDDSRIDWGYAYLAAPKSQATAALGADEALTGSFIDSGALPSADDTRMPRATNDDQPVMAVAFSLGSVGTRPVSRAALVAYDEVYSIKYFGQSLRPYWRRNGATPTDLLKAADHDYGSLLARSEAFDNDLMADATLAGGAKYAQMLALAYRQCLAANGIAADANGKPLMFTKENNSNGDIATVDVIFPQDPMLILLSPTLAKASIVPVLNYGSSPRWKFPNAPHDLGTYPIARGTDDGGEQMPVEESGNIIIICDAIAQEEGNAKWVSPWWPHLSQWAQYLEQYGQDPEDQLCTDDFMGHLAHNSNLSIKAIVALAAYADLCRMRGEKANSDKYMALAKVFAQHWIQAANDGDHSRLAFDQPNTWSQKYNLVWDHILGLNVFPPTVAAQEVAYYKTKMQPYGLPLDSRTHQTKSDWSTWSATLADSQSDFQAITDPIYAYLNETAARRPFADWYTTDDVNTGMFNARPVVGGVFIKMLADPAIWKKWSRQNEAVVSGWAKLPVTPKMTDIVPTSRLTPAVWHYTTTAPPADWTKADFDDAAWKQGPAPIGTISGSRTPWTDTPGDLWIRRTLTLPAGNYSHPVFMVFHDEDVEISVNGVPASAEAGYNNGYAPLDIAPDALKLLKPGATVTLSAHVHQTTGGQGIDIGLSNASMP
jgi:hypothetical protein